MNIHDELHRGDHPEPLVSWEEAASGLDLHRLGVIFRVVVVVAAVCFALLQLGSHGDPTPGGFSLLLGLAEIITTFMSIVGIARFGAKSPASIGGGMSFAVMCFVGVALAEAWSLWVIFRVIQFVDAVKHGHYPDIGGLESAAANLPYVQVAAGVAGLIAILFVLAAIRRVGLAIGQEDLADSASRNQIAVMILAVGYGIVIKMATARGAGNSGLVLLLGFAIYALVVLISYIAILKRGVEAMRTPNPLPVASIRA